MRHRRRARSGQGGGRGTKGPAVALAVKKGAQTGAALGQAIAFPRAQVHMKANISFGKDR